jgi:hypothetical protein
LPTPLDHAKRLAVFIVNSLSTPPPGQQPTSFALAPEAVDKLRAAAGKIVLESPDFQRYLKDLGDRIVKIPKPAGSVAPAP